MMSCKQTSMEMIDDEMAILQGQAEIWQYMFNFADSMALKCAVELRIADIIHSRGRPISLAEIASQIDSPSPGPGPDITCLQRIMRLLVRMKIFTVDTPPSDSGGEGEALYGMTRSSAWLLHDTELTLAPMLLMENDPRALAPWHHLSGCVREGGVPFEKAHGRQIWDYATIDTGFNKLFNDAMACTAKIAIKAVISGYNDGFCRIGSMVDVGGGIGTAVAEIVKSHPHIRGTNFDLPHVIATAPEYPGVSHVGGNMFEAIPSADAVFMKWILHDWNNEDCIKILQNCRKAIPEKTGKVIIVESVLQPEGNGLFDNMGVVFDLLMKSHSSHGKERTELEWKKILADGGFPRYKIIRIPAIQSIIEAYTY